MVGATVAVVTIVHCIVIAGIKYAVPITAAVQRTGCATNKFPSIVDASTIHKYSYSSEIPSACEHNTEIEGILTIFQTRHRHLSLLAISSSKHRPTRNISQHYTGSPMDRKCDTESIPGWHRLRPHSRHPLIPSFHFPSDGTVWVCIGPNYGRWVWAHDPERRHVRGDNWKGDNRASEQEARVSSGQQNKGSGKEHTLC